MRTLAVLSQKGGTGKTSVAVHLAVAAWAEGQRRVLMADLDPQRSAAEWRRAREGSGPVLIESKSGALFVAQQAAARAGVDLMVLDTRPAGDADTAEAIRAADLCLVVLRSSFFDLKATQRMVEMTEAMSKPALFMLNQAPPRRGEREPPQVLETIEALRQRGLPLAPICLRSRAAYQSSVARGLTAGEAFTGTPAAREVALLWGHMEQALWPTKAAPPSPDEGPLPLHPGGCDGGGAGGGLGYGRRGGGVGRKPISMISVDRISALDGWDRPRRPDAL